MPNLPFPFPHRSVTDSAMLAKRKTERWNPLPCAARAVPVARPWVPLLGELIVYV